MPTNLPPGLRPALWQYSSQAHSSFPPNATKLDNELANDWTRQRRRVKCRASRRHRHLCHARVARNASAPAGPPERYKEAPAFEDQITQIVREAIDTSLNGVGISANPLRPRVIWR